MMLTCTEMRTLEERALAGGVDAEALMDDAGEQIAAAVRQFFPVPGLCLCFFGKGHNGGDGLTAARRLAESGWDVHLVPAFPAAAWSPLTARKFAEAGRCQQGFPPQLRTPQPQAVVVLDGLLGSGSAGPLREPILGACRRINDLRTSANAQVFALDLPTGLNGDSGAPNPETVVADFTLAIGFVKTGLVADAATDHVGRLAVLPLAALTAARLPPGANTATIATPAELGRLLPRRKANSQKGDFGRIGILAGSPGFTGAAVMASCACLRAGGGLITLYALPDIQAVLATAAPPEVMVQPVADYREALEGKHDVIALGPGLGKKRGGELLEVLEKCEVPMVVDADGLTLLSEHPGALERMSGARLLTPHPGEMARLDAGSKSRPRRETVEQFTGRYPVTLLLKGARTVVGERGRPLSYNGTGNAGMATGGMGDSLTGVCAALMGAALSTYDAARLGAWLCGRAAELAVSEGGESEESLAAMDIPRHLGRAFAELRHGCF